MLNRLCARARTISVSAFLLMVVLSCPLTSRAQNAIISGTVTDQSQAPVPSVAVTARNTETNSVTSGVTNDNGLYRLVDVIPGHYDLTLEKSGFKVAKFSGITVTIGQVLTVDHSLEIGSVSDTIEVAASVVLICGAALLFKSLAKLQQVDAGVRIDHVITMSTDLPSTAYPTPESAAAFYEAVVQRLRSVPGVEQASLSLDLPLQGARWGEWISLAGVKEALLVRVKMVDPWYFSTLEIPVETGRGIEVRDRAGAPPIMVISQEVARHLASRFDMANPVGRAVGIHLPGYGPIPESLVSVQIRRRDS